MAELTLHFLHHRTPWFDEFRRMLPPDWSVSAGAQGIPNDVYVVIVPAGPGHEITVVPNVDLDYRQQYERARNCVGNGSIPVIVGCISENSRPEAADPFLRVDLSEWFEARFIDIQIPPTRAFSTAIIKNQQAVDELARQLEASREQPVFTDDMFDFLSGPGGATNQRLVRTAAVISARIDQIAKELEALQNNYINSQLLPELTAISTELRDRAAEGDQPMLTSDARRIAERVLRAIRPFADQIVEHKLGKLAIAAIVTFALSLASPAAAAIFLATVALLADGGANMIDKALEVLKNVTTSSKND